VVEMADKMSTPCECLGDHRNLHHLLYCQLQGVAKTGHPDAIKYLSGTYNVGAIVRCHSREPLFIKLPFIQHEFKLLSNVGTCVVFGESFVSRRWL